MSRNVIKYLAKELKYSVSGMSMLIKILFIMECIVISMYSLASAHIPDEGADKQFIVFLGLSISLFTDKDNWGKDVFRMLPLSKEEYQWILILEGISKQFIMSLVVALCTFPAVIIKRDFRSMVIVFVVLLAGGLWARHIGGSGSFAEYLSGIKTGKQWLYVIMYWVVSFLYLGIAAFSMMTEMDVCLNALLSLLFIFILFTGVAIVKKHYMQHSGL